MKFTESCKDTQIKLLALALAGTLESLSRHTEDGGKEATHTVLKNINLPLDDFKTLLNEYTPQVLDEVEKVTDANMSDSPDTKIKSAETEFHYSQSDYDALSDAYKNTALDILIRDAINDGAITTQQLPLERHEIYIAMLKRIHEDSDDMEMASE